MKRYKIWLVPKEVKYVITEAESEKDAYQIAYDLEDDEWTYDYVECLDD